MDITLEVENLYGIKTKIIPGFSRYSISADGKVFRPSLSSTFVREIKASQSTRYPGVRIYNDQGVAQTCRIHRLVALTYLGIPENQKLEVCHNDGNKLNNHYSNLRWDTHANNLFALTGPHKPCKGMAIHSSKLSDQQIEEIRSLYKSGNHTYRSLSKLFNVAHSNIQAIVNGVSWKHLL